MKCKFQHIISFSKLSFIASLSVLTDLFVYFSLKALRLPISQTVWAWLALRSMFQFVESTVIRLDKIQFTSCHRAQDFIVLLRGRKKNGLEKNGVALGYNLLRMFSVEFASSDIVFMNWFAGGVHVMPWTPFKIQRCLNNNYAKCVALNQSEHYSGPTDGWNMSSSSYKQLEKYILLSSLVRI